MVRMPHCEVQFCRIHDVEDSVPHNEIGFSPADFFSREIQGNKCGDPPASSSSSSSTDNDDGIIEASKSSECGGKAGLAFPSE